jgi:hypothetical protein
LAVDKYQFVAGYNNSGSLATLTIQPTAPCPGVIYGVETFAGPGFKYLDNPGGALNYKPGISPDDFNTIAEDLSFDEDNGIFSLEGTLRYRKNDNSFANFNVIIQYPTNGKELQRGLGRWQGCSFPFVIMGDAS